MGSIWRLVIKGRQVSAPLEMWFTHDAVWWERRDLNFEKTEKRKRWRKHCSYLWLNNGVRNLTSCVWLSYCHIQVALWPQSLASWISFVSLLWGCSCVIKIHSKMWRVLCLFSNHFWALENSPPFLFYLSNKPSTWSPITAGRHGKSVFIRRSPDVTRKSTLSFRQECSRTHHFWNNPWEMLWRKITRILESFQV